MVPLDLGMFKTMTTNTFLKHQLFPTQAYTKTFAK